MSMELTDAIKRSILAYCRLDLNPDEEDDFADCVMGAVSYLAEAGVAYPAEATERWHAYMRCLKAMVLDDWDHRGAQSSGQAPVENPAFRRRLNQLKMSEPTVSESGTAKE